MKHIGIFAIACLLITGTTACSSGPMSAKATCTEFSSIVHDATISGESSPEDSKQAASELESLSDRAPESMQERVLSVADALRENAAETLRDDSSETGKIKNLSTTLQALRQLAVDTSISELEDVCLTAA